MKKRSLTFKDLASHQLSEELGIPHVVSCRVVFVGEKKELKGLLISVVLCSPFVRLWLILLFFCFFLTVLFLESLQCVVRCGSLWGMFFFLSYITGKFLYCISKMRSRRNKCNKTALFALTAFYKDISTLQWFVELGASLELFTKTHHKF